jgi:hypothetical protein
MIGLLRQWIPPRAQLSVKGLDAPFPGGPTLV